MTGTLIIVIRVVFGRTEFSASNSNSRCSSNVTVLLSRNSIFIFFRIVLKFVVITSEIATPLSLMYPLSPTQVRFMGTKLVTLPSPNRRTAFYHLFSNKNMLYLVSGRI